jgi:hypothetical protein
VCRSREGERDRHTQHTHTHTHTHTPNREREINVDRHARRAIDREIEEVCVFFLQNVCVRSEAIGAFNMER